MIRHVFASVVLFSIIAAAYGQEFDLSWHSIDGGGTMRSTGGTFELSGTIGQPDAGVIAGGAFELTGGFWFKVAPTDCNDDGAVNLVDHAPFTDCLAGPAGAVLTGCNCYDVNRDARVDLRDFAAGQTMFAGS